MTRSTRMRWRPQASGLSGSELLRQSVHFGCGALALALPYLSRWQAAAVCVAALLSNRFLLPHLPVTRGLFRAGEGTRGGIVLYPLMVLLVVLMAPHYPAVPAAAWGILAAGDAASGVFGRLLGRRALPYNSRKSWAGLLAFVMSAFPAALFLLMWCGVSGSRATLAAASAAVVAGLVESLPLEIDDNITVVVSAGSVLTVCLAVFGVGS